MQDLHDLGTPYAVPPGITVPHLPRRLVAPPPGWVTTADVMQSNGVIHVVEGVLLPR